jgi:hypothetical protein
MDTLLVIELLVGIFCAVVGLSVLIRRLPQRKNPVNMWFIVVFCVIVATYIITIYLYGLEGWPDELSAGPSRYWVFWINHSILLILCLLGFYLIAWLRKGWWFPVAMYVGMGLVLLFVADRPFRFTGIFQLGMIIPGLYVFFKVFAVKRDGRSLGLALGLTFYSLGGMFKGMFEGIFWAEIAGFLFKTIGPIILVLAIIGMLDRIHPRSTSSEAV